MRNAVVQAEIVNHRLAFHFLKNDGTWIIPKDMPFMNEFLNEVAKLVDTIRADDKFIPVIEQEKEKRKVFVEKFVELFGSDMQAFIPDENGSAFNTFLLGEQIQRNEISDILSFDK